jgi:hypothetical protein
MTDRFRDLRKIPRDPARRLLALANARLSVALAAPASAPVEEVLGELESREAHVDMIRLLSASLPVRECIWWSCLAGEDLFEGAGPPPPLEAAKAWVFKPTEPHREAARLAAGAAEIGDDTALCATAVAMHDGKLGGGELGRFDAPPGAAAAMAFAVNIIALGRSSPSAFAARRDALIDRALDIARGGNGRSVAQPSREGEGGPA